MDIKEQILVALGLNKAEEEIALAWQSKGEDGTTILLPVGTYKTDTGISFRVEEEGIVSEVIESETEEEIEASEELSEEVKETELAEEDEEDYDKEDYDEEADVAD